MAGGFTVQVNGLQQLVESFLEANATLPAQFTNAMNASVLLITQTAQALVPVKTGTLQKSIIPAVTGNPPIGVVSAGVPGAPYAPDVEYGTSPHTIYPVRAKALAFMIGGQMVFAKSVNHPGTPAQPFMTPALQQNIANINQLFTQAVNSVLQDIKGA